MEKLRKGIIENYINAYNRFDFGRMFQYIHQDIEYRIVSGDENGLTIKGKEPFEQYARELKHTLRSRNISVTSMNFGPEEAEVFFDFSGEAEGELPGIQPGESFSVKMRAVFTLRYGNIIRLQQYILNP